MFFCLHNGVVGYYTIHMQCPAIMLQLICLLGNANVDGGVRNASFNLLMEDKLIAVISLTKDNENVSLIDISIGFFEDMENKDRERLDIFRRKGQTKANGWTIFERKSSKDNEGKLLGTCGLNLFSNFLPEKLTKIGTNSLMKMKSIFSHRR